VLAPFAAKGGKKGITHLILKSHFPQICRQTVREDEGLALGGCRPWRADDGTRESYVSPPTALARL